LADALHYLKQTLCLHFSCLHNGYPFQTGWFISGCVWLLQIFFLQHYEALLGNVIDPEVPEDEPTGSKHVGRSVKNYNGNEVGVVDGVQRIITVVNNACVSAYSTAGNVRIT
jgi:hypothetical protein